MSARLAALFVAALLGLVAAVGVAVASLGAVALVPYAVAVLALLAALVRRARALSRTATPTAGEGRTCSCCSSTVFDPVEVR